MSSSVLTTVANGKITYKVWLDNSPTLNAVAKFGVIEWKERELVTELNNEQSVLRE